MGSKFTIQSHAKDYGASATFRHAIASIPAAMEQAAVRLSIYVPELLTVIFSDAASRAGTDAFPAIYLIHTIAALSSIYEITSSRTTVEVTLHFDKLGTYKDLSRGFHYGAIRKDGTVQELPYLSGNFTNVLKNDVETRYKFWSTVVKPSSLESDTLNQRVSVWGEKAPEWLLLQYGTDYSPRIQAYPILENVGDAMREVIDLVAREEIYASFANATRQAGGTTPSSISTFPEEMAYSEGRVSNPFFKIEKMTGGGFANTYIGGVFAATTPIERVKWLNQLASLRGAEFSTFRSIFRNTLREEP